MCYRFLVDEADKRQARREARARAVGVKGGLELERCSQLWPGSPGERVACAVAATLAGWEISGRSLPIYARHEAPGRVIRPDDGEHPHAPTG